MTEFPLDLTAFNEDMKVKLSRLSGNLAKCCAANTIQWRKSGLLIDSIDSKPSKPILDEIDRVLAAHYGLSEEELNFIINCDIKCRQDRDVEGEGE